jgi:hypothetical protein
MPFIFFCSVAYAVLSHRYCGFADLLLDSHSSWSVYANARHFLERSLYLSASAHVELEDRSKRSSRTT